MVGTTSTQPTASALDTARLAGTVLLPTLAGGVIKRRRTPLRVAEKVQADRPAVALLRELTDRYGTRPLRIPVPGRRVAMVLSPDDVREVLRTRAEAFTPANAEKRAALTKFQPHGVLISRGESRRERRRFVEAVLETPSPMHHLADVVTATVRQETQLLLDDVREAGVLDWDRFNRGWWRIVRRVTFGKAARDDSATTDVLDRLRRSANWSFLSPARDRSRRRFEGLVRAHLARAEPGTLAEAIADTPAEPGIDPVSQVAHWLFAFDAAGMTSLRALALLAAHPEQRIAARAELAGTDLARPQVLPYLRACELESVRLWPTTPILLRDTVADTELSGVTLPEGTAVVVYAPFFHRDERTHDYANRFTPEIWLDGRAEADPSLVPFSSGPGECPGQNLVLLVTSTLLAALLTGHDYRLNSHPDLGPDRPIPMTIDHFRLALRTQPA
ncbi:cytochrome P450 [Amycolatopsis suaedae]|uniref:Cytochrome P450 n=1 Tax=Amycolatopsis suaedae TaxID=2510978 RepID=A0A4Q7IZ19_9PSEU|nr:cytochrome P450 [Amycolatopsis suaedae]RZQ60271.1 cytochrome P450 [Amycolatopsis suaedae]